MFSWILYFDPLHTLTRLNYSIFQDTYCFYHLYDALFQPGFILFQPGWEKFIHCYECALPTGRTKEFA